MHIHCLKEIILLSGEWGNFNIFTCFALCNSISVWTIWTVQHISSYFAGAYEESWIDHCSYIFMSNTFIFPFFFKKNKVYLENHVMSHKQIHLWSNNDKYRIWEVLWIELYSKRVIEHLGAKLTKKNNYINKTKTHVHLY